MQPMILHITQERYDSGKTFSIPVTPSAGAGQTNPCALEHPIIHILSGERAFCKDCDAEFDSIKVYTADEWRDMFKVALGMKDN